MERHFMIYIGNFILVIIRNKTLAPQIDASYPLVYYRA